MLRNHFLLSTAIFVLCDFSQNQLQLINYFDFYFAVQLDLRVHFNRPASFLLVAFCSCFIRRTNLKMAPRVNGMKTKKQRRKKSKHSNRPKMQDPTDDSDYLAMMEQVKRTEDAVNMEQIQKILDHINGSLESRGLSRKDRKELMWNLRLVHSLCEIYMDEFLRLDRARARLFYRIQNDPEYVKVLLKRGYRIGYDAIRLANVSQHPILAITETIFSAENWDNFENLPKNFAYLSAEFDHNFFN